MKKKHLFLIVVTAISLLVSVVTILAFGNTNASPPNALINCNALVDNGPDSESIVFFASQQTATEYMNYILSVVPFDESPESFSFFYITPEDYEPECSLYKGIALYCYNSEIIKKAGSCRYDYIVVLDSQPRSIRSSEFSNVLSINTAHPLSVFAHEFAHAFDNFAEEYLAENSRLPSGSENCQDSCDYFTDRFPGNEFNCHEGCTKSSLFREFDEGFMKTLSADRYGDFDEALLREELQRKAQQQKSPLTGFAISENCEDRQYTLVEARNIDGKPEIVSIELVQGCPGPSRESGEVTYKVTKESLLEEGYFHDQIHVTDYNPDNNGRITSPPEEAEKYLITTSNTEGTLEIITDGEVTDTTDLNKVGAQACRI